MTKPKKPKPEYQRTAPRSPAPLNEHGLTREQENYCRLRATGLSRPDAAATIHKSPDTVRHWDQRPVVIARIAPLNDQLASNVINRNQIDRAWVMANLVKVAERCMQDEPVRDKEGNPTGEYGFDSAGAIKALNLIGLEVGMFKRDPAQININTQINTMPTDQLRHMAEKLALEVLGSGTVIDQ